MESRANEKFVANAETNTLCAVNTRENPCQTTPYVNMTLLKDLTRPYIQVIGRDVQSGRKVLEQTVNICRITSMPGLDILLKLLLELIKDNVNFQIACPFRKVTQPFVVVHRACNQIIDFQGYYQLKSYQNTKGLLLNLFPVNQTQRYSATVKARVGKSIEDIYTYTLDIDVVEIDNWRIKLLSHHEPWKN